ncbi:MAG: hypothetical protein AAGA78_02565 [Pseudomonadota bacterium]
MDNTQLTWMITGALVAALLTGWVLHWVYALITRPQVAQSPDDAAVMAAMEDAQSARDAAEERLATVEQDMAKRLSQSQAELDAAMDGLRTARMRTESLEQELDSLRSQA